MNPIDDQLNRLFRSAAQVALPETSAAPPFGLETRALAAWHSAQFAPVGFWDMTVLVRGLILAGLIMAASFWPVLNKTTNPFAEYLQLADSTASSDDTP